MSAPVKKCEVTPLEALQRLIGAASMIDANECKDEVIYNVLQGELAVACRVAKDLAAAPVVPVAAQPVVPEGWKLVPLEPTAEMIKTCDFKPNVLAALSKPAFVAAYKCMVSAAPSLEAQPAGEVAYRVTDEMVEAAETVGDLYRLGQPEIIRSAIRAALTVMTHGDKV